MRWIVGHVFVQRERAETVTASTIENAPKLLQRVNRQRVHVSMRAQMVLRDDVLKIRFNLEERQVEFFGDDLGAGEDFLLDARNIFKTVNAVD